MEYGKDVFGRRCRECLNLIGNNPKNKAIALEHLLYQFHVREDHKEMETVDIFRLFVKRMSTYNRVTT